MQCAIYGNFSAPKAQEIIVSRGCYLELLRPDDNGKVQTILSSNVFGVIRALAPFRLTGGLKDYIIIGSDSGRWRAQPLPWRQLPLLRSGHWLAERE